MLRREFAWRTRLTDSLRGHREAILLSCLAVPVGILAGYAAVGFRLLLDAAQFAFYSADAGHVLAAARDMAWWWRLSAPALGGLAVGLLIHFLMPGRRPQGVADVIAARAVGGARMRVRDGMAQAAASAVSIGAGASVGREGPVVHLTAALASGVGQRLRLDRVQRAILLGCGVAAGVAASFNAPLAGVFFALEVVVGHYGLTAFAPVALAGVIGAIITRLTFGDFSAFAVAGVEIASYAEMPAFLLLGAACAGIVLAFIAGTRRCARAAAAMPLPGWLKPAVGGLGCGLIAVAFPEVIGVGYETTDLALSGAFDLPLLAALCAAKLLATILCLGFGFSGGVFSPGLCIGALAGAAFGIVVAAVAPGLGASANTYSMVGMGATAAAVLGAPVSTIVMVFELTGDHTIAVAVMIAVAAASLICRQVAGGSYFTAQLADRGIDLAAARLGVATAELDLRGTMTEDCPTVALSASEAEMRESLQGAPDGVIHIVDSRGRLVGAARERGDAVTIGAAETVTEDAAFDDVLARFDSGGASCLAVIKSKAAPHFLGVVRRADALAVRRRAVARQDATERGQT